MQSNFLDNQAEYVGILFCFFKCTTSLWKAVILDHWE